MCWNSVLPAVASVGAAFIPGIGPAIAPVVGAAVGGIMNSGQQQQAGAASTAATGNQSTILGEETPIAQGILDNAGKAISNVNNNIGDLQNISTQYGPLEQDIEGAGATTQDTLQGYANQAATGPYLQDLINAQAGGIKTLGNMAGGVPNIGAVMEDLFGGSIANALQASIAQRTNNLTAAGNLTSQGFNAKNTADVTSGNLKGASANLLDQAGQLGIQTANAGTNAGQTAGNLLLGTGSQYNKQAGDAATAAANYGNSFGPAIGALSSIMANRSGGGTRNTGGGGGGGGSSDMTIPPNVVAGNLIPPIDPSQIDAQIGIAGTGSI